MRAVIQRVSRARVTVADGRVAGEIGVGLLALIGVARDDADEDARWLADKIARLRVFNDEDGRMSLGLAEVGGSVLAVSQFTLIADTRRGRRPDFSGAARPDEGRLLFDAVVGWLRAAGVPVATGEFGTHMAVDITNDGPVTVILDSADRSRPRRG